MAGGKGASAPEQQDEARQSKGPWTRTEIGGKSVREWLQLLIVPFMLSLITVAFARQQNYRQQQFGWSCHGCDDRTFAPCQCEAPGRG